MVSSGPGRERGEFADGNLRVPIVRYVVDMVSVGDFYVGPVAVRVDSFAQDENKKQGAYDQDHPFQRLFRT